MPEPRDDLDLDDDLALDRALLAVAVPAAPAAPLPCVEPILARAGARRAVADRGRRRLALGAAVILAAAAAVMAIARPRGADPITAEPATRPAATEAAPPRAAPAAIHTPRTIVADDDPICSPPTRRPALASQCPAASPLASTPACDAPER